MGDSVIEARKKDSLGDDDLDEFIKKRLEMINLEDETEEEYGKELEPFNHDQTLENHLNLHNGNNVALKEYLDMIAKNTRNLEEKLIESEVALEASGTQFDELAVEKLKQALSSDNSVICANVIESRAQIIAEIENLDKIEQQELQATNESKKTEMAVAIFEPVVEDIIKELEEKAKEELISFHHQQAVQAKQQEQALQEKEKKKKDAEEFSRLRHRKNQEELQRMKEENDKQQKKIDKDIHLILHENQKQIEKLEETFQEEMKTIEEETEKEQLSLNHILAEKKKLNDEKQNSAAICIQKNFRRFRIEKRMKPTLLKAREERKRKEKERLDKIEQVESKIRAENDRKKAEELEKKKREEEVKIRLKEEAEKKRRVEKENKQTEERFKHEQEKQRLINKEKGKKQREKSEKQVYTESRTEVEKLSDCQVKEEHENKRQLRASKDKNENSLVQGERSLLGDGEEAKDDKGLKLRLLGSGKNGEMSPEHEAAELKVSTRKEMEEQNHRKQKEEQNHSKEKEDKSAKNTLDASVGMVKADINNKVGEGVEGDAVKVGTAIARENSALQDKGKKKMETATDMTPRKGKNEEQQKQEPTNVDHFECSMEKTKGNGDGTKPFVEVCADRVGESIPRMSPDEESMENETEIKGKDRKELAESKSRLKDSRLIQCCGRDKDRREEISTKRVTKQTSLEARKQDELRMEDCRLHQESGEMNNGDPMLIGDESFANIVQDSREQEDDCNRVNKESEGKVTQASKSEESVLLKVSTPGDKVRSKNSEASSHSEEFMKERKNGKDVYKSSKVDAKDQIMEELVKVEVPMEMSEPELAIHEKVNESKFMIEEKHCPASIDDTKKSAEHLGKENKAVQDETQHVAKGMRVKANLLIDSLDLRMAELESELTKLRQRWIDEHNLLKSTADQTTEKTSRRKARPRGNSQDTLPDLTTEHILEASKPGTTVQEVQGVVLKELPGASMSPLSSVTNLQVVKLHNCGVNIVQGLGESRKLLELDLQDNIVSHICDLNGSSLEVLRLKGNNLASFHGLDHCTKMEVVDCAMNKITRFSGLPVNSNLQHLQLDSNQLISTKNLHMHQNLMSLNISNNHITSVIGIEHCYLLQSLTASMNSINEVPALRNNVLLLELHLDHNCIADLTPITLAWLPLLEILTVAGNSIESMPSLKTLISLEHFDFRDNLVRSIDDAVQGLSCCWNLKVLQSNGNPFCADTQAMNTLHLSLPWLSELNGNTVQAKSVLEIKSSFHIQVNEQRKQREAMHGRQEEEKRNVLSRTDEISMASLELERALAESRHRKEAWTLASTHVMEHLNRDLMNQRNHDKTSPSAREVVFTTVSKDTKDTQGNAMIARQQTIDNVEGTNQTDQTQIRGSGNQLETTAAIRIQAVVRGFLVRRRFFNALHAAANISNDSDGFDYDEEVDLAAFDFDDSQLEWKAPKTPDIPSRYPVLPRTGLQATKRQMEPKTAWLHQERNQSPSPRPPTSRLEVSPDDAKSSTTSRLSSQKTEEVTQEWGFKNTSTAELMLKRAKRMRTTAAKRKIDADKRFAHFKKMESLTKPDKVAPWPRKRTDDRINYFAAKYNQPSPDWSQHQSEAETKKQMTYSWVHDQAVLHRESYSDVIAQHEGKTESLKESASLPLLDPDIIAGRRVALVASTLQDTQRKNGPTNENIRSRQLLKQQGSPGSSEKSHSAPDPLKRTPPYLPLSGGPSSRSGSAEGRRRQNLYRR